MRLKTIALFFLLLQAATAAALGITLEPSQSEAGEGSAVDFIATIEGAEEGISIEWDFGDGQSFETDLREISHSFYLKGFGEEEEFTVEAKAVSNGEEVSSSAVVKVKRLGFKVVLSGAIASPENAGKKGEEHEFSLLFYEAFGEPATIDLNSEDNSLWFTRLSGEKMPLDIDVRVKGKNIEVLPDARGILNGSFSSDSSFGLVEKVEVKAALGGGQPESFSFPLFFKPARIDTAEPFAAGKEFALSESIGALGFEMELPGGVSVSGGEFTARIVSGERVLEERELSLAAGEWVAEFDYSLSREDFDNQVKVLVSGKDAQGNFIEEEFIVPLAELPAEGETGGGAPGEVEKSAQLPWEWIAGIVVVIALAAFSYYFLSSRKKDIAKEKAVEANRLGRIDTELKQAKKAYFKRRMTEQEYRGRVLKLEQEKEQLQKRIGKNKKSA